MDTSKNRDYTLLLLPLVLIGVVIIKFPHLFLPHYWDEAWSYSPAVQYMYEHRLSLIPGALPPTLSRGHPLLFYFLSAGWMRIFGPSLFAKHCFAMTVSLIYLVSIYYIVRKLFSARAGIMATIFTSCQALFLAQASMLLPEIMLSLFSLWTLFSYLENRKFLFLVSSSMLIMTKETGIFLLILLIAWHLFSFLLSRKKRTVIKEQLTWFVLLTVPFMVFAFFLIIQQQHFGWYLFPEHVSLITTIRKGLKEFGSQEYFLQFYGQIFLVITLVVSFIIQIFSPGKIPERQKQAIGLIFAYILFYLFATTFLMFSPRYLICIHVMLVILTAFYLDFVTSKRVLIPLAVTAVLAFILLFTALTLKSNGDNNLGYADALQLQKKAVEYFEKNGLYDHTICCGFLMRENMTVRAAGFLEGRPFTKLTGSPDSNPEYLVLTSTEPEPDYYRFRYDISYTLVQRYFYNYMWMEIYKRK